MKLFFTLLSLFFVLCLSFQANASCFDDPLTGKKRQVVGYPYRDDLTIIRLNDGAIVNNCELNNRLARGNGSSQTKNIPPRFQGTIFSMLHEDFLWQLNEDLKPGSPRSIALCVQDEMNTTFSEPDLRKITEGAGPYELQPAVDHNRFAAANEECTKGTLRKMMQSLVLAALDFYGLKAIGIQLRPDSREVVDAETLLEDREFEEISGPNRFIAVFYSIGAALQDTFGDSENPNPDKQRIITIAPFVNGFNVDTGSLNVKIGAGFVIEVDDGHGRRRVNVRMGVQPDTNGNIGLTARAEYLCDLVLDMWCGVRVSSNTQMNSNFIRDGDGVIVFGIRYKFPVPGQRRKR